MSGKGYLGDTLFGLVDQEDLQISSSPSKNLQAIGIDLPGTSIFDSKILLIKAYTSDTGLREITLVLVISSLDEKIQ